MGRLVYESCQLYVPPVELTRDNLGKVLGQEFLLINSDESDGPGKHWVAMVNRNDRIYFDSFGVRPLKEVEDLVQKDCTIIPTGYKPLIVTSVAIAVLIS